MKKSLCFKAMALIVAMTASMTLASCGDDDDDKGEPADPAVLKAVSANYTINMTEDMLSFYDVTITYGVDDSETSDNIDKADWSVTKTYTTPLPKKLHCRAVAVPKVNMPAIDPEKVYTMGSSYGISVSGTRNDNQSTFLDNSITDQKLSVKGDKLQVYLDKGERTIVSYSYDVVTK